MLLLVSGATATVRRCAAGGGVGHLLTPANGNRVETLLADELPLAADNGCFRGLDAAAFRAMCQRLRPHAERVLWVVAPDVVANAYSTLVRFWLWQPMLAGYKLPVAYVAQDGQEHLPVPWTQIRCLFVGGSTAWKEGPHALALIREAKRRGLWVHVGRVSTQRRMRLFAGEGVDSIDSTAFSRWPDTRIPLRVAAQAEATVELIAARSSVPVGDTLSLAGIVRPSSATPISVQAALSLSPDIASAVLLKSANGECDEAARSCTLNASVTTPAQMTIAVVVRSDAPTPGSFTATLVVTGVENGQSEPASIRIEVGSSPTPTATATTQPTTTPTATEADTTPPTATLRPSPSATPDPRTQPDRCEPNNTPQRACAIPLDAISGPFTLVPDGDNDYYQLDLGPNSGKPTVVWVRGSDDLDLLTTILAGEDHHQVGLIADGAISTTLASDLAGQVLLHVESRAVEPTSGGIYRVEARRSTGLPPPPPPQPRGTVPPPDALENNWSPATAPVIGLDVAYDLNFTCPVAWGCAGGDHDYVKVPVKAGQDYLIATFDLGPGVDTVLDLFWGDETVPVASNDDAAPGTSALSALRWRAPSNGTAVVRIAPRAGNLTPIVDDQEAGTYRFAVALPRSAFGRELLERIATQTLATPTATRRPPASDGAGAAGSGSAGGAGPVSAVLPTAIISAIPPGPAQLMAEATVYLAPDARSERIATLGADTLITLTGQTSNLWVEITSDRLILPGWVAAQAVQRIHTTTVVSPTATVALPTTSADGTNAYSTPAATLAPAVGEALPLTSLPPLPVPPAPVAPREAFALTVVLQATNGAITAGATPTPSRAAGLDGMRVQLVDALGDVLVEGVTRDGGRLMLARDLAPATSVWVRVPAVGITAPVLSPQPPSLTILVPTNLPGGIR